MAQLVAHLVRDQEVARSSRVTQTAKAAGMHPAAFFAVWVTPLRSMNEGALPLVLPCVGLRPPTAANQPYAEDVPKVRTSSALVLA